RPAPPRGDQPRTGDEVGAQTTLSVSPLDSAEFRLAVLQRDGDLRRIDIQRLRQARHQAERARGHDY
ncbi:unnamed protein product, partial [Amoebophrya sp. A25]